MLKKIVSMLMLNCLLLTSAQAASGAGLKSAFDSLSYSLTVEWDQQDQDFAQNKIENFQSEVNALRSAGLSQSEVAAFLKEILKGKANLQVDSFMQKLESQSLTQDEVKADLGQMISLAYNDGAHYLPAGKVALGVLGAVGLIFVVSMIIVQSSENDWMGDWK